MMKTLLIAACAASLLMYSCKDDKGGPNELEPTVTNLAGTWKAETYKLNGNEIAQSRHAYDYIHVGTDARFTARFSLLDALANQDGYCYGPGAVSNRTITLQTNSVTVKADVTSLTEKRLTVKNAEGYEQTYSRVDNPTLYKVANNLTFISSSLRYGMISFGTDADNHIQFQNVHGLVPCGTTCNQIAYTPLPKSMHVLIRIISPSDMLTLASVYPQKMIEGSAENVIFMADSTITVKLDENSSANLTKVNMSALPAKPLSEWMEEIGK